MGLTALATTVADVARWQGLVDELGDEVSALMAPVAACTATHAPAAAHSTPTTSHRVDGRRARNGSSCQCLSPCSVRGRVSNVRGHRFLRLLPLVSLGLEHGRNLRSLVLAADGRSGLHLRVQGLHGMDWEGLEAVSTGVDSGIPSEWLRRTASSSPLPSNRRVMLRTGKSPGKRFGAAI